MFASSRIAGVYMLLPFSDIDSNVGWTVTSLEVENSIRSSALRSIPPAPSAILLLVMGSKTWGCDVTLSRLRWDGARTLDKSFGKFRA